MADYQTLGSRQVTATADETGLNTGNWTCAFTTALLPTVAVYEIYHAVVTAAPAGSSAVINIDARPISFTAPGLGGGSEWDPNQAPIVTQGQEVYFFWSAPASGVPPVVTIWLRYDTNLPGNAGG